MSKLTACLMELILNNGEEYTVRAQIYLRNGGFNGYLTSIFSKIEIAAKDRSATLCMGPDLYLPIRVGALRRGRLRIAGSIPRRGSIYGAPVRSCRAEEDLGRGTVEVEINRKSFVLSVEHARLLARELGKSLRAVALGLRK